MRRVAIIGTLLAILHLVLNLVHAKAHYVLHIEVSLLQMLFVVGVILSGPSLATILLWTRFHYAGLWLFALSMAGAFVFGGYYHFIVPSPDHVAHVPAGSWGDLFRATAVVLALAEALGSVLGFAWLRAQIEPLNAVQLEHVR